MLSEHFRHSQVLRAACGLEISCKCIFTAESEVTEELDVTLGKWNFIFFYV